MQTIRSLLTIALLALCCLVGFRVNRWLIHVDQLTRESQQSLRDTTKRTDAILTHLDAVMARSQRVMEQVEDASRQQKQVTARTLQILDSTDAAVKQMSVTVSQVGAHTDSALDSIPPLLESLHTASQQATATLRDTDALITSPEVKGTLASAQTTSAEVAKVRRHSTSRAISRGRPNQFPRSNTSSP